MERTKTISKSSHVIGVYDSEENREYQPGKSLYVIFEKCHKVVAHDLAFDKTLKLFVLIFS